MASDNYQRRNMYILAYLLMVLSLCCSTELEEKEDCDLNELQQCMSLLQTINNDHDLAFACTEKELYAMCRTMQSGLECVHNFVSRCFNDKRRQYINNLLQGAQEVINLLCTPGAFRTKYLRHAPCMKNISTDPKLCGHNYEMLIQSVKPSKDQSSSDAIRRQCCAFHSYLLCVTEEAEIDCGVAAAEFIRDYSLRTAGPLIKNQCKNYISGSVMCTFSDGCQRLPGISLTMLCLSSIVFFKYVLV